jgi:hypothetical protein
VTSLTPGPRSVGRFTSANGALALVTALAGAGRLRPSAPPSCYRWSGGHDPAWFVVTDVSLADGAEYVELAGGQVLSLRSTGQIVAQLGRAPAGGTLPGSVTELATGQQHTLPELIGCCRLWPTGKQRHQRLAVLAGGRTARWVLRRFLSDDIAASVVTVEVDGVPAMLVRLHALHGWLPADVVTAIGTLPGASVFADDGERRLLVQAGHRLPVVAAQLAAMVPAGQSWLLDGGGGPVRRMTVTETPISAADLFIPPEPTSLPRPEPDVLDPVVAAPSLRRTVRVAHRPTSDERVDAVLVADVQLELLTRHLSLLPAAEHAVLVPGAGHHLLVAPAAWTSTVPLGVPLRHAGPGGFYLESGCTLEPRVPVLARPRLFGIEDGASAVAACRSGTYRFALADIVPAWTLWLGPPPPVADELPERSASLLAAFAASQVEPDAPAMRQTVTGEDPLRPWPATASRHALMTQAGAHVVAERFEAAAELYGLAGEDRLSALMYERAARQLGQGSGGR